MRKLLVAVAAMTALLFSHWSVAQEAVAIDYLVGEGDVTGVRLGYRPHHGKLGELGWFFDDVKWLANLDLHWEVSLARWEFDGLGQDESNYVVAFSPVIGKEFAKIAGNPLKWEAGIGIAYLQDSLFGEKDLGSHFQFEDRIGLVYDFGEQHNQSVHLRYMHYSNGGLNDENPGIDFFSLSYAYRF